MMIPTDYMEYCGGIIPRITISSDNITTWTYTTPQKKILPKEYYINTKKKAVVLKWSDDTITKVKTSKDDKFDIKFGFLLAYFQKNCGMTKTQANKYLDNIREE